MKKVLLLIVALALVIGLTLPMASQVAADGGGQGETLYLADTAGTNDGKTVLYSVELDNVSGHAILTPLPNGEIPFNHADAIACTPDGTRIYCIDDSSSLPCTRQLGYYDVVSETFTVVGEIQFGDGTQFKNTDQAAFSPDGTLYITRNETDKLYVLDTVTAVVTEVGTIKKDGLYTVDIGGADIVFDAGGTVYLWVHNSRTNAPRGLYTFTVPGIPGDINAQWRGDSPAYSFTGMAIREDGLGDLVGSTTNTNEVVVIDKTNGSAGLIYPMYLDGVPFDHACGDMTVGELVTPSIDIVKSGPHFAYEGDAITYEYAVHNDGDAPLDPVTVVDSLGIVVNPVMNNGYNIGDINKDGILDPCETWIFTADYSIPQGCDNPLVNTATATGYYGDVPAIDTDSWEVNIMYEEVPPSPGTPPDDSVGGEVYPVNKLGILLPWVVLATIIAITGVAVMCRRTYS